MWRAIRYCSPLDVQIALLAHDYARHMLGAGVVENLVIHGLHHLEAVSRGDAVHQNIAMDTNGMLGIQNRVLVLPRCVDDVTVVVLALVLDGLLKDILDGRVVRVDECIFYVSHDER